MKSGERFDEGCTGSSWRWRMRDEYNENTLYVHLFENLKNKCLLAI